MDGGTPHESRFVYSDPVTLPDGTETCVRCAHCGTPYVPKSRLHRACSTRCREALRALTPARIAGQVRRSAASYQRDGAVYRAVRRALVRHGRLTPETDALVRTLRGRHDLTLAAGWAALGLTPPSPLRAPRKPARSSDAPTPDPAPEAPRTAPPESAASPWALPSPSAEYAGYYLGLDLSPRPDPAITLRHTRLLHGALCHAAAVPHATGRGNFSLRPVDGGCGWGATFFDRSVAERLRGTSHAAHLGDRAVTLRFAPNVIRVKAPAPLAAGRYRVTVETITPTGWTTQGHKVFVDMPKPSTLCGACARVASIVGVTVPESSMAFRYVDSSAATRAEFVGGHWQRGSTKAGVVKAIDGRITTECNAVAAWLLLCGARVGIGGCTSIGFGHVRVTVEPVTADVTPEAPARSVYTVSMSSLSPRAQERMG